jgi:cyanophycinase
MKRLLPALVVSGIGLLVAALAYSWFIAATIGQNDKNDEIVGPQAGGALIVCGGGTIPEDVRTRFIQWAGGSRAKLVVIPAYDASKQKKAADKLLNYWKRQGPAEVKLLSVESRTQCDNPALAEVLENATGVWLGGGDQAWLSQTYAGTEVERQLKALLARGGVVGGNSAGAAIMSRVMIASGQDEATEQKGFDLLPDAVIDQHFLRRNRVQRLLGILSRHPGLVGFGIDEKTAIQVRVRDMWLSILGQSYVIVCQPPSGDKPARIQVLKHGDRVLMDVLKDSSAWIPPTMNFDAILSEK